MKGIHGRFLRVDLTAKKLEDMPIAEELFKQYVGGSTLAAKLINDHITPEMAPLAPESPLIFATGPLTGSSIPMVSRYAVGGLSPLTGYWGEATSGGAFPFRLKQAGYDGIFIIGKSDQPVYLYLDNGKAELRDASDIWGRNIYEAQDRLRSAINQPGLGMAVIGPAGENLAKTAGIMNDAGRTAGRCGLGALMGSKQLKAVVVSGKMRAEAADPEKLKELTKEAMTAIKQNIVAPAFREYGTLMYTDLGMSMSDVPVKYFQKSVFPATKLTGQALRQKYVVENYACVGCPIGCGREVKNFRPGIDSVDGPEYETTVAFGPLCMNFDFDSIIEANYLCNAHGIDTISLGVSIAYAMYLYELGVLTKEEAGMEIKWGDGPTIVKLVEMSIRQEGIGKLISQGTLKMAEHFGRDPEEAAQVKGMEVAMHDPRAFSGMALSYATGPRGACHLKGDYYNIELGSFILEYNILPGDRFASEGKAEMVAKYQNFKDLFDSLTLCKFAPYTPTLICQALNAITGWNYDPQELLTAGERSITIKRVINNRRGLTRAEDKLPKICLKALEEGSSAGKSPDLTLMLKEYYAYRDWDWETGKPKKEKLLALGMEKEARQLYP
ncbi:MAG TPA: aldehyde ferredoxin oxidoreductase family protein [Syntrophales bacterium]|nr:aldehyde ferredoxin oxidoreductase family protein [Syntrophales bacterium]HOL58861.1 aldehyde ferredoxin oxidoreductase family protein [Syntrophales bacterium]HPO35188.1 aldehyde ferredoxin oxidoreductase family protein [Syntrophales bacterium]